MPTVEKYAQSFTETTFESNPSSLIFDVVGEDQSEAENVGELKDARVIPDEHV